jgi:hypothetical protein
MAKPWVRLYRDAILKPKVGRLTLEQIGFWSACLMLSDDDGSLPSHEDIAWQLRLDEGHVSDLLVSLIRNGLVTRYVTEGVTRCRLHDWDTHQRKSDHDDSGAERQRKFREAQKAQKSADSPPVTERNALRNEPVTLPDTDTDTDTEKNRTSLRSVAREADEPAPSVVEKHQRASRAPAGSSWPPDAVIPVDWVRDAEAARARAGKAQIDLEPEAERFANHFAANGKRMKDWRRAWLNWATSPYVDQLKGSGNGSRTGAKSQLEQLADIARNGLHGTVING